MAFDYFKKIDRSMMEWGMTLPDSWAKIVLRDRHLKPGNSTFVKIHWDKQKFKVRLSNVKRTEYKPVYQIRWDTNRELLSKIRSTFISSYISIKSLKEVFDSKNKENKYFRTNLVGGDQEVLQVTPTNRSCVIHFKPFIIVENKWNPLFRRLADQNVFSWLFDRKRSVFIQKSYPWISVREFKKHAAATNVIYYLFNSKRKELYVGKAEHFGKRVKPGRMHQGMKGDWDKFRYDILSIDYAPILEKIEDHTIRSLSSILNNNTGFTGLGLSQINLVNKSIRKN